MASPNGAATNTKPGHSDSIPATHLFATFIASARPSHLTAEQRSKVKEVLLDYIGVTLGANQHADSTAPILKSITALQGPAITKAATSGVCSVVGQGVGRWLPQYAGLLNAALGHSLDFDDTYAPGTLHAGVTAIPAALATAEYLSTLGQEVGPERLILAVAVSYEVTCRIGRELGYAAYSRGFHNTSTAGIFGAVAAIAMLKGLNAEVVEHAFGVAGSKAAGSMQYLENGSWNKRLHPGFAVHDAWMSVQMAEAGVVGAAKILEGKSGFFNAYTPSAGVDLGRLTQGLGSEWCWLASSLKPYPACRMTHGFIELCGKLHEQYRSSTSHPPSPQDIEKVQLWMSPSNFILIGDPTPNKRHPTNNIDAQFSAYFQVANALIFGAKTGDMNPYSRLADPSINTLTEKIDVKTDEGMKQFSARLEVSWADGRSDTKAQEAPLGEVEHPFTRDLVEQKFHSLVDPVFGEQKAAKIAEMLDGLDSGSVMALVELLR
ncbi:hypothetical protein B0A50_08220 [Salinomyces thailandicus]|uniref:MmgE/PrpD family protein n=1 Tax=Salinomyces thailandicus TaxID=706561 RepID=A0A4U0TK56_9PEZI|nr:hypothetical protein B0A50_08220 [Salinomyces thailandica]